jgi:glycosyltransferase involved in cell wall biosynthesis
MSKGGILGRCAAAAARVPRIVHSIHGWSFDRASSPLSRQLFVSLERFCGRMTHRMLAVSPVLIENGIHHGITGCQYVVGRSGFDLGAFRCEKSTPASVRAEVRIPSQACVIGTVMGLNHQKAPLDWIALAANLCRRLTEPHFLIVGDGPLRDEVQRAIDREKLAKNVHLVGMRTDIPRMLRAMDVFVLTSHWEGLPRVIFEAMSVGIPVVATRVGGVMELVKHEKTGLLAEPGDISMLTAHVVRLLRDPAFAGRLADAAAHSELEQFDTHASVAQYACIYRELMNSSEPHSGRIFHERDVN